MARIVVLWRNPYHLPPREAEVWLREAVANVVVLDDLPSARVTALESASAEWQRSFDWLIEFRLDRTSGSVIERGSAFAQLLVDMQAVGPAPAVALARDQGASELRR